MATVSVGGTLAAVLGLSGGVTVGINIPNGGGIWDTQIVVGPSAAAMVGAGLYAGFGLSGSYEPNTSILPLSNPFEARYVEGDIGGGVSLSESGTFPINGTPTLGNVSLSIPRIGTGGGDYLGAGRSVGNLFASPTLDQVKTYLSNQF